MDSSVLSISSIGFTETENYLLSSQPAEFMYINGTESVTH